MSIGGPSLATNQKREKASSGPPFPAGSANNGLSVSGTGEIVLGNAIGGNAAALLSTRQIPLAGFQLDFLQPGIGGDIFTINSGGGIMLFSNWSAGPLVKLSDQVLNRFFEVDQVAGFYGLGDVDLSAGGQSLSIDDLAGLSQLGDIMGFDSGNHLSIEGVGAQAVASLGDENAITQGAYFLVRNGTGQPGGLIDLQTGSNEPNTYRIRQNNDSGNTEGWLFSEINGPFDFLLIDPLNDNYNFGDISSKNNGTALFINDATKTASFNGTAGANKVEANQNVSFAAFGAAPNLVLNNTNATGFAEILFAANGANRASIDADYNGNLYHNGAAGQYFQLGPLVGPTVAMNLTGTGLSVFNGPAAATDALDVGGNIHLTGIMKVGALSGFTGTVGPVITSITVVGGVVTNVV